MAVRIAPLYLLSGFGGSLLSCLHREGKKEIVSVGASGALFGLAWMVWTIWHILEDLSLEFSLDLSCFFVPNMDM